ncbi:MAG TPA: DUF2400 family protein, partial [Thermoanaerobaculia bacterium]|nr:DUF2400 family protein [Thermoanaerobaculia bacterium]
MSRPKRPDLPRLSERLRALRDEWGGRRLDSDPLAFPHRYASADDREVVAFLAASFAFGRVASIRASLERLLSPLGSRPSLFLDDYRGGAIPGLDAFTHRWVTRGDAESLLHAVARARRDHGSLRALFASFDEGGDDYIAPLQGFNAALRRLAGRDATSRGLAFLLASPEGGAACKRAHLFLRWMIRSDGLDLGLWTGARFTRARLLLPMDT